MGDYRDDRAAQRERIRVLEEELAERDAELEEREAEIARLEKQQRAPAPAPAPRKPAAPKRSARPLTRPKAALGAVVVLLGMLMGWWGRSSTDYGQARVYVADPRIDSAIFYVDGEQRCTGKICDLKLRPGTYRIRAVAGNKSGETTIVVKAQHSLAKPVPLH